MYSQTKDIQFNRELFSKINFIEDSIRESLQGIEMIKHVYFDRIINKSGWKPKVQSLKGLWKGVKVEEEDFQAAKKSLFPYESN